ncbi:hypothetical protein LCGC14_0546660 [marine sediment metagenome]|uniref:Uncharacterized protein n=1 Tax=marine sediment metagenome TaxID=412755 RepID=A0A0F9UCL0_9ZZZZ
MEVEFNKIQKTIIINNWIIKDPELIEATSDFDEDIEKLEYYLMSCLRTGAVALKAVGIGEKVDFIQKRFNSLKSDFDKSLIDYKDELLETLKNQYKEFSEILHGEGGLKEYISDTFGEKGTVNDLIGSFFGKNGDISKLLSLELPDSPLHLMKKEFLDKFEKLSLQFENYFSGKKAEEIEKEKGTRKGYDYEDQLEVALNEIAKSFNDIVVPTRYITTGTAGKKGDFIIEINSGLKEKLIMTIEAKSGKQSMSGKRGILKILDDSMNERSAGIAIAALRDIELIPKTYRNSIGVFREYGNNKIICIANENDWFPMDVAYKVARSKLLMMASKIDVEINPELIKSKINSIINMISQFKGIQGNLAVIIKNIETAKSGINNLKSDILSSLNEIQMELVKNKKEVK